jgi:hypothetical protein
VREEIFCVELKDQAESFKALVQEHGAVDGNILFYRHTGSSLYGDKR